MLTGSCFRRNDAGDLIDCRSYTDEAGHVWTVEVVVELADEATPE